MYGMPYIDSGGEFGISRRDLYVIVGDSPTLEVYHKFLCSKLVMYLYDATRYRMRFLERYIFQLLPNPTKLTGFPAQCTDAALYQYFGLTDAEIVEIEKRTPGHLRFEY